MKEESAVSIDSTKLNRPRLTLTTKKLDCKISSPTPTTETSVTRSLMYHLYTIWLFTLNDLKSIVMPETAFGVFSALSGSLLTTNPDPSFVEVLFRLPKIVLWNWLNLLIFDLANQRLQDSILEDKINKPWRPIPSQRISALETRRLLLAVVPIVVAMMGYLGGMRECVAMLALTWMYNDLGGADESYIVRNTINALGFICYSAGSAAVAAGYGTWELSPRATTWLAIVGAIVFSTLQMQDMADVEGDAVRGRRTLPIVYGQTIARWSIAFPVLCWSLICPLYWKVELWAYVAPFSVGALLAGRVLVLRTAEEDRKTWKLWCMWTLVLYLLPLCNNPGVFIRSVSDAKN